MTARVLTQARTEVQSRRRGFVNDVFAISRRAIRSVLRDPEAVIPGFIIPLFFFTVNTGALENLVEAGGHIDYRGIPASRCHRLRRHWTALEGGHTG